MKIDLPRARVAPVPETPFFLLFSFFSFLAHCSHDLFFLSVCPWVCEHRTTFPLLRATLHSITNIQCVCLYVCMRICAYRFFFPFLYSALVKQMTTKERANEREQRREKGERERLNYNHSDAIYILKSFIDEERRRSEL